MCIGQTGDPSPVSHKSYYMTEKDLAFERGEVVNYYFNLQSRFLK